MFGCFAYDDLGGMDEGSTMFGGPLSCSDVFYVGQVQETTEGGSCSAAMLRAALGPWTSSTPAC